MSDELWDAYHKNPTHENRNALVESHLGLVHSQASDWHRRRNQYSFFYEDFVSWGCIGLTEAVSRFNPKVGVAFSTYAFMAIRNAIVNGINQFVANTQRTDAKKRFAKRFVALESWQGTTPDHTQEVIQREHNRHEAKSLINRFVSDWQREAFELHYLEGIEQKEIAERLGLEPTRVHQMICMGKQRIKKLLRQ